MRSEFNNCNCMYNNHYINMNHNNYIVEVLMDTGDKVSLNFLNKVLNLLINLLNINCHIFVLPILCSDIPHHFN